MWFARDDEIAKALRAHREYLSTTRRTLEPCRDGLTEAIDSVPREQKDEVQNEIKLCRNRLYALKLALGQQVVKKTAGSSGISGDEDDEDDDDQENKEKKAPEVRVATFMSLRGLHGSKKQTNVSSNLTFGWPPVGFFRLGPKM